MYETLLSPVNYGGLALKNRIIFAPTTMGLRGAEYHDKLEQIAAGGCAMIVIGDVPVSLSRFGLSLFSGFGSRYYAQLAQLAHRHDCLLCAQLHQSDSNFSSMRKYIPGMLTGKIKQSQMRSLMNESVKDYISTMPVDKIQSIAASFGPSAVQARKLGFDAIQIHGDRMCGSFSSAVFNHRQDQYGGSAENRARFAVEAVRSVHEALPDLPIDYKLAVRQENPHYGNAGVLLEELETFVPLLEEAGVTSFHVTLADHSRLEDPIPPADHPYFSSEGCFLPYCDAVRKLSSCSVCGVGGLSHPDFVEEQLQSGRIDCAAMSRQLIADPDWVNKVRQGETDQIHLCRRCNRLCLGGMYQHKGVHCIYEGSKNQ